MSQEIVFFTDDHVSKIAVNQLRRKGVSVIHCTEVDMKRVRDEQLLEYTTQQGYIMVSCDRDFEDLHYQWQMAGRRHGGIVYFRMEDQCKSIGKVVEELLFLFEAADYEADLYNQLWRATS